jgi:hypothetical protein
MLHKMGQALFIAGFEHRTRFYRQPQKGPSLGHGILKDIVAEARREGPGSGGGHKGYGIGRLSESPKIRLRASGTGQQKAAGKKDGKNRQDKKGIFFIFVSHGIKYNENGND